MTIVHHHLPVFLSELPTLPFCFPSLTLSFLYLCLSIVGDVISAINGVPVSYSSAEAVLNSMEPVKQVRYLQGGIPPLTHGLQGQMSWRLMVHKTYMFTLFGGPTCTIGLTSQSRPNVSVLYN